MDRVNNAWRTALVCALLGAATLGVYWPVTRYGFINFDDPNYLTENTHVRQGLTWANAAWAVRTGDAANWHPLTWVSHMLDVQLFGLQAGRHHLTNLVLHTANTLLLFLVLKGMTGATWRCALVAALFGLHPLHVESVAWVAERKDVLSALFFILTLWAYGRYVEVRSRKCEVRGSRFYVLALVFFGLGLMSKPMLVTLPFVLLLLDIWPLRRLNPLTLPLSQSPSLPSARFRISALLLEKVPFFCLAIVSSVVTYLVQRSGGAVSTAMGFPLDERITNAIASYLKYLGKTIWPTDLAVFYPHPGLSYPVSGQWPMWQIAAAALLLAAVSALAALRLRTQPWLATGWFWYLGTLVPVIGLVQVGGQAMADRYSYIPLIGVFICLAWGAAEWAAGRRVGTVLVSASGILTVLASAVIARRQVGYWKDDFALFERALAVNEKNAPAHFNLGTALGRQGKYGLAIAHCRAALQADPSYADAYYALGYIYTCLGKPEEAIRQYQATLRLKPDYAMAHNNLGAMYWLLGKKKEAFEQYADAARSDRDLPDAQYNLGMALADQGKLAEAAARLGEAIRLKPDYVEAMEMLGNVLGREGKLTEAQATFQELVRLSPTNAEPHLHLAASLQALGKPEEALAQYAEALRWNGRIIEAHYQMGRILLEQGKLDRAEAELKKAVELRPSYVEALEALGRVLAMQGKFSQAQTSFREALYFCPTNADTYLHLGNTLVLAGQTNEAKTCFADALRLKPDLAEQNVNAGKTLAAQGQIEAALGRFTTALWLRPDNAEAHEQAGLLLARQGKMDRAILHFREAVGLRPDAQAYYNLGLAEVVQGRGEEAVVSYKRALELKPDWIEALNDLAWLLATDSRANVRDGTEAVRLAERACQLSSGKQTRFWGTLDAAYAEAGRYPEAITTAEKTRDLARAAGEKELADAAERRLALYRKQQPFRQNGSR